MVLRRCTSMGVRRKRLEIIPLGSCNSALVIKAAYSVCCSKVRHATVKKDEINKSIKIYVNAAKEALRKYKYTNNKRVQ